MKRFLLTLVLVLGVTAHGYSQTWQIGSAIGDRLVTTDDDSVYFDGDTLKIFGADTAYIYINSGNTLGMITYKGLTYTNGTDSAICRFYIAEYKGLTYNSLNTYLTETWYAMDSSFVAGGGIDGFYFYPFQETSLDQKHVLYYLLRITGSLGKEAYIILQEERIKAY